MSFTTHLRTLYNLIYVPLCGACNEPLVDGERVLCTACRWNMPLTYYWAMVDNHATRMMAGRIPFVNGCSFMFFGQGNEYRLMIHRFKYYSQPDIAKTLGYHFGRLLSESPLYRGVDLVVAVPLHWTRRWTRGYNQSEIIGKAIAISMGVAYDFTSVRRIRRTAKQARRHGSHNRLQNVKDAFRVVNADRLAGRHVLLVDDVLTTGATLEAVAIAILERCVDIKISFATIAVVKRNSTEI